MGTGVVSANVFCEDAAASLALPLVGSGVIKEVLQNGIIGSKSADQFRIDATVMLYLIFRKVNAFGTRRDSEIPVITVQHR